MTTATDHTKLAIEKVNTFKAKIEFIMSIASIRCPSIKEGNNTQRIVYTPAIAADLNKARLELLEATNALRPENFDYPLESRADLDYMLGIADEFCKLPFVVYSKRLF